MAVEGKRAPAFDMLLDDGSQVRLTTLRGQPVVLFFYPADDTETCTLEAQQFSAREREFSSAGVRLIGVSPDSLASHCNFRSKYALAVSLASDPDLQACKAYGVWTQKTLFGRTYMGVERTTVLIDANGDVAKIWRKVRLRGHVEAVIQAVRALPVAKSRPEASTNKPA